MPTKNSPITTAPDLTVYFAYGSNLSENGMAARCPESTRFGTAVLKDWKLVFNGVADVEPSPGDKVLGGLWLCTPRCVAALDRYEGVAGGFYRKVTLTVETPDGPVDALVYVMNPSPLDRRTMPSESYFQTIVNGYRDFGLPMAPLRVALRQTHERVTVKHGVTEFVPHGPKRMGPKGTRRLRKPAPAKSSDRMRWDDDGGPVWTPRKPEKKAKAKRPAHRASAATTRSGRPIRPLDGPCQKSPATLAMEAAERREREARRGRERNELALAILEGAQ